MTYSEMKNTFQELKRSSPREDLTAHIIFTEDSFAAPYPLLSRTYLVSSDNKAFWPNIGGYSIFAYCLDKNSDQGVRLDWYMADEGNANGWKVQECYILERMRYVDSIPGLARVQQPDDTVRYFFGGTSIQVRETADGGRTVLEPLSGIQCNGSSYEDLPIDRVYGYCTLLERHINGRQHHEKTDAHAAGPG